MHKLEHPKIIQRGNLLQEPACSLLQGRVVFTNGCFDILHPGHADLLARARALGDTLVVGVNNDASVGRLKGKARPVNCVEYRMYMLAALSCVDVVTCFSEDTPLQLITEVQPLVLVKGGDWAVEDIVGASEVQAWGGSVCSLPLLAAYSTTRQIRRIIELYKQYGE